MNSKTEKTITTIKPDDYPKNTKERKRIVMLNGYFEGFYFWGKGFADEETENRWKTFWNNLDSFCNENRLYGYKAVITDKFFDTRTFVTNCGYVHIGPVDFAGMIMNPDETQLAHIKRIYEAAAEACGGTVEISTTEGTWCED